MLQALALVGLAFGGACVVFGAAWRRGAPRLDERYAGDELAARATRDGGALAFAAVGLGVALVGVGTLGTMARLAGPAGPSGPLATLGAAIPARTFGGLLVLGGFVLFVGAVLVPVAVELRGRLRG
ncbi:hypothetical protein M0R89_00480 [Halorussus limi]|uniref:Uncharacterized protein n=1 Tax=Halorussus limi TaxID=2938695 RepID=A0A8U0HUZ3_9EURY|nr:hypothetical protein [Halorussus limi]UPV74561.1 hypothetical protein M0R89_00480 [Halorussus limi]